MNALRNWFEELTPREQTLVAAAGLLLAVAIVVIGLVRPVASSAARNAETVAEREALLAELTDVATRLGPQRGNAQVAAGTGNQSLVLIVDQSTRQRGLQDYLVRNQPDGSDKIRLRFERAPFDDLVEWLVQMSQQHGLGAISANIDTAPESGRVNCNLVLSRSG